MSDSEEEPIKLGTTEGEREFYGSLEDKIETDESKSPPPSANIHTSNEYMEVDEPFMLDEKKKTLEEFERKRRARLITVPTDDLEVKRILREQEEPVCLFGEGPADRRNRLKDFLSKQDDAGKTLSSKSKSKKEKKGLHEIVSHATKEETWYHRGPASLKEARMFTVNYSVPRARARIRREKLEKELPDASKKARKQDLQSRLRNFSLIGSQNADTRPISFCAFSPNGEMLATSSWSGIAKVWNVPDCSEHISLMGHTAYIDCIDWHPAATLSQEPGNLNLVTSSRDGIVNLWNLKSTEPIGTLPKFEGRVSRIKFHPSGRFIGACVHDNSWRLWDLQVQEEVLFQEGHSKGVYTLGFQKDGALAATGSMDSFGRVWDLRTGRCVMFLNGHIGPILTIDWSSNCYQLVTGSEDNTVRIWDVRARKSVYIIPAHTSIISGVAYDPSASQYLTTCSYDGAIKIWCYGSYQLLNALEGHGQKVMSIAVAPDGNQIASCSFDRTFKLWGID